MKSTREPTFLRFATHHSNCSCPSEWLESIGCIWPALEGTAESWKTAKQSADCRPVCLRLRHCNEKSSKEILFREIPEEAGRRAEKLFPTNRSNEGIDFSETSLLSANEIFPLNFRRRLGIEIESSSSLLFDSDRDEKIWRIYIRVVGERRSDTRFAINYNESTSIPELPFL